MPWCLIGARKGHHNRNIIRSSTLDHPKPINVRANNSRRLCFQNPFASLKVFFAFGSPDEVLQADGAGEMLRAFSYAAQI